MENQSIHENLSKYDQPQEELVEYQKLRVQAKSFAPKIQLQANKRLRYRQLYLLQDTLEMKSNAVAT